MNHSPSILSILFHNYYGNEKEWLEYFSNNICIPYYILFNSVPESFYIKETPVHFSSGYISDKIVLRTETPNKGKDIGGKLALIDGYLKTENKTEYLLLLHDKRSRYRTGGNEWKEMLLKIATERFVPKVLKIFERHPDVGIVAAREAIVNEMDNNEKTNFYTDSPLIKHLKITYNIHPPNLIFVAGTMFWVRSSIYEEFFTMYHPLRIRSTLENGNITDHIFPTVTHAWERLLSWLATSKGYKIRGI